MDTYLKRKLAFYTFAFVLYFLIAACSSIDSSKTDSEIIPTADVLGTQVSYKTETPAETIVSTMTATGTSFGTMTPVLTITTCVTTTPTLVITPFLTATPISTVPDTQEGIENLVVDIYKLKPECILDVLQTYSRKISKTTIEFRDSDIDPFLENYVISEIADNISHYQRAYVSDCAYPNYCFPRLYLRDLQSGNTKQIIFIDIYSDDEIDSRAIGNLQWIGDELLVFRMQRGIEYADTLVINIKDEKLVILWRTDNRCE